MASKPFTSMKVFLSLLIFISIKSCVISARPHLNNEKSSPLNLLNLLRGYQNRKHANAKIHTTSHYAFIEGEPKWPKEKSHLFIIFDDNVKPEHKSAILRAFDKWASVSHFKFSEATDYSLADIQIGFYKGYHQDPQPFDGVNGVLAHGVQPPYGILHFDIEEPWSVGAQPNKIDLETVATHEVGHLLGLGHSNVQEAVMYFSISKGKSKSLHEDDIQAIRALYADWA